MNKRADLLHAVKTGNINRLKLLLEEGLRVEGLTLFNIDTTDLNPKIRTEIGRLLAYAAIRVDECDDTEQHFVGESEYPTTRSCL